MAKFSILCFIVLITALQASAQKIRFNDTSNVWVTCGRDPYTWMVDKYGNIIKPSTGHRITKDTAMNGHTYYFHNRYNVWVRAEDTTEQKFYFTKHPDSAEHIFMDFTMAVGDSAEFPNYSPKLVLTKIDSIQINGVFHKIHYFSSYTLIEGIGPNYRSLGGLEFPYYEVCCFKHKGQYPALSYPLSWFDNVSSCVTSVSDIRETTTATVVPNPATPASRIILPYSLTNGRLTITNAIGQTVLSRPVSNEAALPLPTPLPAGMYFYLASDETRAQNFSGRFIVE